MGLVLLPTLYWGLDLLWHAVLSHSPLLLLANVVIPFAVSVGAFLSWKAWSSKLSQCASLGFLTWLGIYVSGPTYMLLQARLSQGHVWSSTQGPLSEWVFLTLAFPFTTFSFSTYDATLPAPFLTWLGVWLAGRIYATHFGPHPPLPSADLCQASFRSSFFGDTSSNAEPFQRYKSVIRGAVT